MRLIYLIVFGSLGVLARYGTGVLAGRVFTTPFPAATFAINLLGAFLIGIAYVAGFERAGLSPDLRVGLMAGFLGGFTTFSAYSLETLHLLEQGRPALAAAYWVGSPVLGLACAAAGVALARALS